jgi:hypothetical protein
MSEQAVVGLSDGDRRALFLEAQKNTGMVAEMIEKDFWVCWILRHLFDLPGAKDHFISRHYADVAALANTTSGDSAIQRDDLRARAVAHKQVFFPAVWSHTETAVPGTFRIMPQKERAEVLACDYTEMRDMFFREPPPWNEILDVLTALERRINSP